MFSDQGPQTFYENNDGGDLSNNGNYPFNQHI